MAGEGTKNQKANDVDDRGTTQEEALQLITSLRDQCFDSNNDQFAVALGRNSAQVSAWLEGTEPIDDDVVMKARGIALARGVELD